MAESNGILNNTQLAAEYQESNDSSSIIVFGNYEVTIEDVWNIAHRSARVKLSENPAFLERISKGPLTVQNTLDESGVIYGVNTGYGNSCTLKVPRNFISDLPEHLVEFLCCGMGKNFNQIETRSFLVSRLASLARGFSGVRLELLAQLVTFLQNDILPCVPETGSVGASGDLVPLSYIAAAMCGRRNVMHKDKMQQAGDVLKELGIPPIKLGPKEGLALVNGTSVMTGLASLAFKRAEYLTKLCCRITSFAIVSLRANLFHYDQGLFGVKAHPGQQQVATRIRSDLSLSDAPTPTDFSKSKRIQDRYSLRCAPHIIGVLEDSLPFFRKMIEQELNSANDNPIIDVDLGRVFHGAMYYGGHIAFAMDGMKLLVANLADLMDRQMALLVDPNYSNGLPENVSSATGPKAEIDHGLKGLQICISAWTAEALKNTVAASIFSRSTECHNQDKVSMGTISARDCLNVLELTEQVAAALLIAVRQGMEIRNNQNPQHSSEYPISKEAMEFSTSLQRLIPLVFDGVTIDPILRKLMPIIQNQELPLYKHLGI